MFKFPADDLQDRRKLVGLLGHFWSEIYQEKEKVLRYAQVRGELERQVYQDLQEAALCVDRVQTPIFHTELWYPFSIKRSDRQNYLLLYGEGAEFDSGTYKFGVQSKLGYYAWALPENLVSVDLICDKMEATNALWTSNCDFLVDKDRGLVVFREDPFSREDFSLKAAYTDAEDDLEVTLWLFRAKFEKNYMAVHHGNIVKLIKPSSQDYKDLVNSALDSSVAGSSKSSVERALTSVTGIPLAKGDETVELIQTDNHHLVVATEANVYRFNIGSNLLVELGDELKAGQPLIDGLRVYDFHRGEYPTDILSLSAGKGFLIGDYLGPLAFENREVPLEVSEDGDGHTRVEFHLGGFPLDAIQFWDTVHANGLAAGNTLAQLLDERTNKVGEPSASNLPETVNPMEFFIENFLRFGAILVRIQVEDIPEEALGLENLWVLRRMIPPHTTIIVLIEMPTVEDSIILDDTPGEASPGGSIELDSFTGGETFSESLDPDQLDHWTSGRVVTGDYL